MLVSVLLKGLYTVMRTEHECGARTILLDCGTTPENYATVMASVGLKWTPITTYGCLEPPTNMICSPVPDELSPISVFYSTACQVISYFIRPAKPRRR